MADKLERYNTVAIEATSEFVEKKSRFISHVKPVSSEAEAVEFIEAIKKQYWDARHNVYAYIIGKNSELQRYSDDGEPQGTGGIPMLEVLRGACVTDTVAVVTRYFGGTLLGTGGLVRAYTRGAKDGLDASGIITMVNYREIRVLVDYTTSGKVQYEIMQQGYRLKDTVYGADVEFVVLVQKSFADSFVKAMVNLTSGRAQITEGEECWLAE
jgi:uncharacterized YigZ family protein